MKKYLLAIIMISALGLSLNFSPALAAPATASDLDKAFIDASGLGTKAELKDVVGDVIKTVLSLMGVILVVLLIYAGFLWMTAAGNDDQIAKSKKTMTAAVIGVAIILSAYMISYFVLDQLLTATGANK